MTTSQTPADRLVIARVQAGYETAKEFSDENGIPQSTYSLHESGKRSMRPKVAERYAAALGNCTAAWLLYGIGEGATGNPRTGESYPRSSDPAFAQQIEIQDAFSAVYDRVLEISPQIEEELQRFGYKLAVPRTDGGWKGIAQIALSLVLDEANPERSVAPGTTLLERSLSRFRSFHERHKKIIAVMYEISEEASKSHDPEPDVDRKPDHARQREPKPK